MTSPGGMSCETCQDLLIELVCDELPAEQAAAVRAHALKCERCGPELEKLSFTLQASSSLGLLSPSPEVEHRIMQAAREAIAGRARGPAREAAAQSASYGGITEWFARLGSFAMSPQVAMASVLLLVVGIGLYALPFGRHAPEPTALRAAEEESEEQGAAPSPAASATAAPVERAEPSAAEEFDGRSAGSAARGRGDLELKKGAQVAKEVGALGAARSRKAAQPADSLSEGKDRSAAAFPGAKSSAGPAAAKPKAASRALDQLADDFAPEPSMQASGGGGASPAKREAAAQSAAASNQYAPAPPAAPAVKSPRAVPATAPAPARDLKLAPEAEKAAAELTRESSDKRAKSDAASALEQGIAAIKRGDHAQGQALLKPIASGGTGSDRTTAMLWLARSLRERGDCAAALTFYKTLTQAVTASRAVLEEAADCQARTGNAAAAERLRARAAQPTKQ